MVSHKDKPTQAVPSPLFKEEYKLDFKKQRRNKIEERRHKNEI